MISAGALGVLQAQGGRRRAQSQVAEGPTRGGGGVTGVALALVAAWLVGACEVARGEANGLTLPCVIVYRASGALARTAGRVVTWWWLR
jgi:hypothetical protein